MMKKVQKIIAIGACLAICGGALAACGKKDPPKTDPFENATDNWSVPADTTYWLAGNLKGFGGANWDPPASGRPEGRLFEQNADNTNLYRLRISLYGGEEGDDFGDSFKIRYEGLGWDEAYMTPDENGHYSKLAWDVHLNEAQRTAEDAAFVDAGGMGGQDFGVAKDGKYEIRINVEGEQPVVSYVLLGEADALPVAVEKVTLSEKTKTLKVGETLQLTATVTPDDAADKAVTWTSGNTDKATVSETGLVTAVAVGENITIKAQTSNGKNATCVLTIIAADAEVVNATAIALNKTETTIHAGATETLTVTKTPVAATDSVAYSVTEGTGIVTVSATGEITAVKPGTATVTVTCGAGGGELTKTCTVTVPTDYYLIGQNGSGELTWNPIAATATAQENGVLLVQDATDATKYVATGIKFYSGDQFKIAIVGNEWVGAYGIKDSVITTVSAGNIGAPNDAPGTYTVTFTLPAEGAPTVEFERTGDAPALALTTDLYISGNFGGDSSAWEQMLCKTGFNAGNEYTQSFTVKLAQGQEFGFRSTITGSTEQHAWQNAVSDGGTLSFERCEGINGTGGGNSTAATAGIYQVTVTLDAAGKFVSIRIEASEATTADVDTTAYVAA